MFRLCCGPCFTGCAYRAGILAVAMVICAAASGSHLIFREKSAIQVKNRGGAHLTMQGSFRLPAGPSHER